MIDDAKLQKVILGPDWIDLSFGEPSIVMEALYRELNRMGDPFKMPSIHSLKGWTYQPAAGKPDLVKILEDKYGAKVVVGNGAKQALAAALYAFKKHGVNDIWYDIPYYPANPSLVESVGLVRSEIADANSFLITSPNNPDGKNLSNVEIMNYRHRGPTIHDAAYYTPIYLPEDQIPIPMCDIQIYSMSKMYGVSGLRIGYAVCHNEKFYQDMVNYMELTTAGVSTASQDIARNIELFFKENPRYLDHFHQAAREAIKKSREALKDLDPEVLIVEEPNSNSMFAWCRVGPKLNNKAAKVHILPGEIFGKPGYMRLNIAFAPEIISEAVSRLNKHKI
jgi:aspartate/methionine/tyrosine aminotransferase